ncbi:MAG: hypothetical protein AAF657_38880, partial [Acidobacteriota bacterium]
MSCHRPLLVSMTLALFLTSVTLAQPHHAGVEPSESEPSMVQPMATGHEAREFRTQHSVTVDGKKLDYTA